MNIKTFLMVALCAATVLWSCKKDEQVPPEVVADFTFESGTEGAVSFTNTSENATGFTWNFGDGNTSKEKNPTIKYTKSGNYTVKLTATNAGGSATKTATVTIVLVPTSGFSFTQSSGGVVTFENTSKNATSYTWDFGDGNTSTEENPTHMYAKDSTYTVKLTATNGGESADTTATVTIDNAITIAIADLSQLAILENRPKGDTIGEIVATVANTNKTPVYSILSQNPAGAVGIEGSKMVVNDSSAFDYATNTEITGEIQGTIGSVSATAVFTISIEEVVNIPDENFKAALVKNTAINTNGDREISVAEAQALKGRLSVSDQGISDATGIEYFTNITELSFNGNALTDIDVSNNTALINLYLGNNQLTAIDVSNNTELTQLGLSGNNLTEIDISKNTALTQLNLTENELTEIDVSKLIALVWLFLQENQLTSLDFSQNTGLRFLFINNNQLTSIDVSNNTALTRLWLQDNNDLTKVNLANGNNDKLTDLDLTNNPNLTCVQVDDPSNIPSAWNEKYDKEKVTFQTEECK